MSKKIANPQAGKIVHLDGMEIELRVGAHMAPTVLRAFAGVTAHDKEVDNLLPPRRPLWLAACVGLLRWYRRLRQPSVGARCVFDPSCSRYSELVLCNYGFRHGLLLTLRRLYRCRPGPVASIFPDTSPERHLCNTW